jgi:hypothetical protein
VRTRERRRAPRPISAFSIVPSAATSPRVTGIVTHASSHDPRAHHGERLDERGLRVRRHRRGIERATGLPGSSTLATSQSSAFLSDPGTPCAYSGLQISSPSARRRAPRARARARGHVDVVVRVEVRQRREAVVQLDVARRPGATARERSSDVLDDCARRLPEIARMRERSHRSDRVCRVVTRAPEADARFRSTSAGPLESSRSPRVIFGG